MLHAGKNTAPINSIPHTCESPANLVLTPSLLSTPTHGELLFFFFFYFFFQNLLIANNMPTET